MATRFVRVDVSDTARDYRPIAVEPGVPLLDRSGANARIVLRWIGGMVAEPAWEGDCISFYVRDDHGGRLEEIVCQPASDHDLKTLLKDEVERLRHRIEQARPETPTERVVHKILQRSFVELVDSPNRSDLDSYFFRYRDVTGNWRLVWCWGFQRVDQEPAPAVVCTDPECAMLFVRRPGKSPRCPSCEALLSFRPLRKTNWKVTGIAALLLLLLVGVIFWWGVRPHRLIATPNSVIGPVGSRIEFEVRKAGLFRKQIITQDAVGISYDPRVARFNQVTGTATLLGPGSTTIRFQAGDLQTEVAIAAEPAANPERLAIEPKTIELGVGTTARLKVIGEYKDGTRVDLSDVAHWKPQTDKTVYAAGGLVEGLAVGTATIEARYRANPGSPYLDASATVTVAKIEFQSLEVGVEPGSVGLGLAGKLRMDAVGDDGKRYSVLESSQVKAEVEPSYLATVLGRNLRGERTGTGKLAATFGPNNLGAETEFNVVPPAPVNPEVRPDKLDLVVGEIMDLSYVSPRRDPLHLVSTNSGIVEITASNRIIGRAVGDTQIDVSQAGQTIGSVAVTVTRAEFQSIAIDPGSMVVAVDETMVPRVVADVKGSDPPRTAEIAPELVTVDKVPSPRYADFNARLMELRGTAPTSSSSPQTLALRLGGLRASASVEVVVMPCRLEISPPGPIDLPLGQLVRLQASATYGGARRVQVPAERLKWASEEKAVKGLKLYGDRIGAIEVGAGPLNVYATYFGQQSNRVAFKSVAADPNLRLALDVDRTIRLSGESGQAMLLASSPAGDVELVPELSEFKSSDEKTLKIGKTSGTFVAGALGEATVTAAHKAAKEPVSLKLRVCDPAKARLVFEPATVRLALNEQAMLKLFLEVQDSSGKSERAAMEGQGIGYSVAQPQAVRWSPPTVVGLSPSKPFEITASYAPTLSRTASAQVEVVDGETSAIQIVPAEASLAPGQTISLTVQQQVTGSEQWKEVRPSSVAWTVPPGLAWAPASEGLRPAVTVPRDAKGELTLQAGVGGQQATMTITVKESGPDAKDPAAKLVLTREPDGRYLPVGQQQRYAIMVDKDGTAEPAADVRWPPNFENEFIKWEAPVLTAKKGGYSQWLRAEAGGRSVLLHTRTCEPGRFEREQPRGDVPQFVKILSDQGKTVRFPIGAIFKDFRVEAHYPDGFTRLVTKRATLRTPEAPDSAILSATNGRLVGVRVGTTSVSAEYDGVKSTESLGAEVLGAVDVDRLVIEPSPLMMRPGETFGLKAIGYKSGKSVGDITGLGNLTWTSDKEQVARVNGPSVTGASLGLANVTAKLGPTTSVPAQINVVDSISDNLKVEPKTIILHVGESVRVGSDIQVFRGDLDVSQQCEVVPEMAGVVRYVPDTRALVGERVGKIPVAFAMGDKVRRTLVEVLPNTGAIEGEVVIEPPSSTLAPGQCETLRVYVVTKDGDRVDRTASAVLRSSDPQAVSIQGDRICAMGPGKSTIKAAVSGAQKPGTAFAQVNQEEISSVIVDPARLDMSVGETARVQILGQAPCGTHEIFPQPDLKVSTAKQGVVSITGSDEVRALTVGQDSISVVWRNKPAQQVQVNVGDNPMAGLKIEPALKLVTPGTSIPYEVTAMRGGNIVVLTPAQGVQLFVDNQAVAQVVSGLTVAAKAPGRTTIVAQLGNQKAEASLEVAGVGSTVVGGSGDIFDLTGGARVYDSTGGVSSVVVGDGGSVIVGGGASITDSGTTMVGKVVGLRFEPDILRLGTNAQPALVRVFEKLENGLDGREVSTDPALEISEPSEIAKLEKSDQGPMIRPVAAGQSRIAAKLGEMTSVAPLLIDVGGEITGSMGAKLVVGANPLMLWSGETTTIGMVRLDPGGDQSPFPVEYKVTAAEGQGIVTVESDNRIRAASVGTTQVTVTTTDPKYSGISTPVTIQVTAADTLTIQPADVSLQVGESTGPIAVMAQSPDGGSVGVPAMIESVDQNVLASDPNSPGTFVAKSQGQTQLRAVYRGKEVIARVSVTGKRFVDVKTTHNEVNKDEFDVSIEVLAAAAEGELEYRVYAAEQPPKENWVPNQPEGASRKVTLRTDPMKYGPRGEVYHLVIEARDKASKGVQQYPLTLQLGYITQQVPQGITQPKDKK